jgi:hypothetical protein
MAKNLKISVITEPPNALVLDLVRKYNNDLDNLLKRNFGIMDSVLTPEEVTGIILSGLATRGIKSSKELCGEKGLFIEFVKAATEAPEK